MVNSYDFASLPSSMTDYSLQRALVVYTVQWNEANKNHDTMDYALSMHFANKFFKGLLESSGSRSCKMVVLGDDHGVISFEPGQPFLSV